MRRIERLEVGMLLDAIGIVLKLSLVVLTVSSSYIIETQSSYIHSKTEEVIHGLKPDVSTCAFKCPHGGAVALQQWLRVYSQRK